MNNKSFGKEHITEKMSAVFIVLVLIITITSYFSLEKSTSKKVEKKIPDVTIRCIENYKFAMYKNGDMSQIVSEYGRGVRCDGSDPINELSQ